MIKKFKKIVIKKIIEGSFIINWTSILFSPVYIARKGIHNAIENYTESLQIEISSCLDFGCGTMPYRNLFSKCSNYVGVDVALPDDATPEPIILFGGDSLPFPDETFDLVLAFEVLEHIKNPTAALTEIRRVMKPGGHLLVTVPFVWEEHEAPNDYYRFSTFALVHMLDTASYDVKSVKKLSGEGETLIQLLIKLISKYMVPEIKYINYFFILIFIFPLNLLSLLLSQKKYINSKLYLGIIACAQKK